MLNAPLVPSSIVTNIQQQSSKTCATRTLSGISVLSGLSYATSGSGIKVNGSMERLSNELKKLEIEQERLEKEVYLHDFFVFLLCIKTHFKYFSQGYIIALQR